MAIHRARLRAMILVRAARDGWHQWRTPPSLGVRGERAAARYLRRRGYQVVSRRARDRLGEIDIVCVKGERIVFVEVKTRRSESGGAPSEAVDAAKQRRLTKAALSFLRRHDLLDTACRFDVVSIVWQETRRRPAIEHIQMAFEPPDRWQMHA